MHTSTVAAEQPGPCRRRPHVEIKQERSPSVRKRSIDRRVSSWRLLVRVVVNSDHDQLLFVPVSAD